MNSTFLTKSMEASVGQLEIGTVLQEHARWLRAVVFARLRQNWAVDEVMQDVALAFVRSPSRPSANERIGPWLYRVAIRQALLFRRKLGRERKLVQAAEARAVDQSLGQTTDPLSWLLSAERNDLLRQALLEAPKRDVEALLLKHVEDWSYRDIALRLGISVPALEARLHRARRRLRERLGQLALDQT